MGKMSPSAYWNMAARISAKAAICTDCVDEKSFFASGQREGSLLCKKGLLGPEVHALNIGCGIGRIERAICKEVASVTGVDVSSRMVKMARRKVVAPNVQFRVVDGRSLSDLESEHYDLCVSFIVLQHISRFATRSYIAEVARVLKPGGSFLFQLPLRTASRSSEPPPDHPFGIRFYTREQVLELTRAAGLQLLCYFDDQGNSPASNKIPDLEKYEFYHAIRPRDCAQSQRKLNGDFQPAVEIR